MLEVLGAVLGDSKLARSRGDDLTLGTIVDGLEFATMLQGQSEEVDLAQVEALMAEGEPKAGAGSDSIVVPEDIHDAPFLELPEAKDSFPILLARREAKTLEPDVLDSPVGQYQPVKNVSGVDFEPDGDTAKPLQQKLEASFEAGKSTQGSDALVLVPEAPSESGSDRGEAFRSDVTMVVANIKSNLDQDLPLSRKRAVEPTKQDPSRVANMNTVLAGHSLVPSSASVEPLSTNVQDVRAQELPQAKASKDAQTQPTSIERTLESSQKQILEKNAGLTSSWIAPYSKHHGRSAGEDIETIAVRSLQPPQQDAVGTTAHGNVVKSQVVAAPLFVSAQRSDDLAKVRNEREGTALDVLPSDLRGSERLAGPASLTAMGTGRAELPAHVAQQLAHALRGSPKGPVEVALQPEELGRVKMIISASEAGVVVSITAERQETYDMMRRHAASLSKELADLGFGSVDLSFEQRGEHRAQSREEAHSGRAETRGMLGGTLDETHLSAPTISGGLDSTKALDKRI